MGMQEYLSFRKFVEPVKSRAIIVGGNFRLDISPSRLQVETFRKAVFLHNACLHEGLQGIRLGVIINDMGMKPEQRPKATGRLTLPEDYAIVLEATTDLQQHDLLVFYESTLRNAAMHDWKLRDVPISVSENGKPRCVSIMGRFYHEVWKMGFDQLNGFFTENVRLPDFLGREDKACSFGPIDALFVEISGYATSLETVLWFLGEDGAATCYRHKQAK